MKISVAESRVLDVLWRAERPLTSEEVSRGLADDQEWAHATVRSLLGRLVSKKAVVAVMEGRRYLYRPLVERTDYVLAESQGLLDRLFGGELAPMVNFLAKHRSLTPAELDQLKVMIAEMEKKRD